MFEIRLDRASHTPPYLQVVAQVREALQMGWLAPGDQLPAVREVAGSSGINPNTVLKAYHELAVTGLTETRPGSGTYLKASAPAGDPQLMAKYRVRLEKWASSAREAGLADDDLRTLTDGVLTRFAARRHAGGVA
jgi:GntR family transcriptional regulator